MPDRHAYVGNPAGGVHLAHGQPAFFQSGHGPATGYLRADGGIYSRAAYPTTYDIVTTDIPTTAFSGSFGSYWNATPVIIGKVRVGLGDQTSSGSSFYFNTYQKSSLSTGTAFATSGGFGRAAYSPDVGRFFVAGSGYLWMADEAGNTWAQTSTGVNLTTGNNGGFWATPTQVVQFNGASWDSTCFFSTCPLSAFSNLSGTNTVTFTSVGIGNLLSGQAGASYIHSVCYDYPSGTWIAVVSDTSYQNTGTCTTWVRRSTDFQTWTTTFTTTALKSTGGSLAVYVTAANGELFLQSIAATSTGFPIYHSTDHGQTWMLLCTASKQIWGVVQTASGGYLFVACDGTYGTAAAGSAPTSWPYIDASGDSVAQGNNNYRCASDRTFYDVATGTVYVMLQKYLAALAVNGANFISPTIPSATVNTTTFDAYIKV